VSGSTSVRAAWLAGTVSLALVSSARAQARVAPVSVADLIGMTLFSSNAHNGANQDIHVLSPDGRRVAVVVQTGNLTRNSVDYALLVFSTTDLSAPRADTVASLASVSNDPAISHVQWLADGRTLAFLGARPGEHAQVYTVDIGTRVVTPRTHSATGIASYEIAPAGEPVVYQPRGTIDTSRYASLRAHGFALPRTTWLSDASEGDWLGAKLAADRPQPYRIARSGADSVLRLPDSTAGFRQCRIDPYVGPPLGPRGDAMMLICLPRTPPASWSAYRNRRYRFFVERFDYSADELVLFDLTTGATRVVSGTPLMAQDETNFAWAPDGRRVIVSTALLPLTGPDSAQRATHRMAAEIDLRSGAIAVVAGDSLIVQRWDALTGLVEFAQTSAWFDVTDGTPRVYVRKTQRGWAPVRATAFPPRFVIDEGPNTPPRLVAVDFGTRAMRVVLDPTPDLRTAGRLGRVEVFHWTSKLGKGFAGGLYYPPDYVEGRRYPFVIQTHGYDSTRFSPDGAFTTDQAAQPVAGSGFLVLQAGLQVSGDTADPVESPGEAPAEQDMLEGAIDALDRRGLIDPSRVGLQGFSRTCFTTLYFLTHSSYPIAAADVADGVDYGYFQYLAFFQRMGESAGKINGGRPWGPTQAHWLERAAGFALDHVTAPLRLTAIGSGSLLMQWEPYAGLLLQGKPAELVYIPQGDHILVKPWERLTSQQGAVDWWRFWLQGYEDPDSTKAEQYARWRTLRAQRDSMRASTSRRGSP
jgi:dipeptidyl aminopeptidase/acylaminoacyl peptidase